MNNKDGIIIKILEEYDNGLPKYVNVIWNDNVLTKEYISIGDEDDNLIFHNNKLIKEKSILTNINNTITKHNLKYNDFTNRIDIIDKTKHYSASPGSRLSNQGEYFSVVRLYNIKQNITAYYLNNIRLQMNLSKKDFINKFPVSYKHKVSHWLRNDLGGSIPSINDWKLIEELFVVNIKNYICKRALKLQTVNYNRYKVPDDVVYYKNIEEIEQLI